MEHWAASPPTSILVFLRGIPRHSRTAARWCPSAQFNLSYYFRRTAPERLQNSSYFLRCHDTLTIRCKHLLPLSPAVLPAVLLLPGPVWSTARITATTVNSSSSSVTVLWLQLLLYSYKSTAWLCLNIVFIIAPTERRTWHRPSVKKDCLILSSAITILQLNHVGIF